MWSGQNMKGLTQCLEQSIPGMGIVARISAFQEHKYSDEKVERRQVIARYGDFSLFRLYLRRYLNKSQRNYFSKCIDDTLVFVLAGDGNADVVGEAEGGGGAQAVTTAVTTTDSTTMNSSFFNIWAPPKEIVSYRVENEGKLVVWS